MNIDIHVQNMPIYLPSTVLLVQYHILLYTARFILVNMTEMCRWRVNYFFQPLFKSLIYNYNNRFFLIIDMLII